MERLFAPLGEDQMTFPPNFPGYVPPELRHGFAYGMNPFPDGLYGQFPSPYQVPPTANAAVFYGGPTMNAQAPPHKSAKCEEAPRRRQRRDRYKFTPRQLTILAAMFETNEYPDAEQRAELVLKVGVDESRIQVWFKNRRAKERTMGKQQQRDQRLSRAMRFNYQQPEPEPQPEPYPFAYGRNSPAIPVQREFPKPSPYASELNSAVDSVKVEEPTWTDAGHEETDTTYAELGTAPPAPDQSASSHPFSFDPFLYPYYMAEPHP